MKGKSSGSVCLVEDGGRGDDDDGEVAFPLPLLSNFELLPLLLLLTLKPLRLAVGVLDRAPPAASVAGTEAEAPISKGEEREEEEEEKKKRSLDRFLKEEKVEEFFPHFSFDAVDSKRKQQQAPSCRKAFARANLFRSRSLLSLHSFDESSSDDARHGRSRVVGGGSSEEIGAGVGEEVDRIGVVVVAVVEFFFAAPTSTSPPPPPPAAPRLLALLPDQAEETAVVTGNSVRDSSRSNLDLLLFLFGHTPSFDGEGPEGARPEPRPARPIGRRLLGRRAAVPLLRRRRLRFERCRGAGPGRDAAGGGVGG